MSSTTHATHMLTNPARHNDRDLLYKDGLTGRDFVHAHIGKAELDRLRAQLRHSDRDRLTVWEVIEISADERQAQIEKFDGLIGRLKTASRQPETSLAATLIKQTAQAMPSLLQEIRP